MMRFLPVKRIRLVKKHFEGYGKVDTAGNEQELGTLGNRYLCGKKRKEAVVRRYL